MANTSVNIVLPRLGYTIEELGKAACPEKPLSRASMYREIRAGRLKVTKIGKRTIVTIEQAKDWLERRARTTPLEEPEHLVKARAKKQACST
jgi:hypothetical protein